MEDLLTTARNAHRFLITFTMSAEKSARASTEQEKRSAVVDPTASKNAMPSAEKRTTASSGGRWNVNTEGVESLDDATLDHLVSVACGAGTSYRHEIKVGSMLVPVLVKAGDWKRLATLVQSSPRLEKTMHFAMHGIGMVMQNMVASGKTIPDELHDVGLEFVDIGSPASLRYCIDIGKRLADFYASAELWMPLLKLANHARTSENIRVATLQSVLNLLEETLKKGKEVPEAAYSLCVAYLRRDSPISYTYSYLIGKRLLEICHNHGVKSVLLKVGSTHGIPENLMEKANLMALDLVSGTQSKHPDPADKLRRQMARAIETKRTMTKALPPASQGQRALPPPVPAPVRERSPQPVRVPLPKKKR
jgi:hypothetical protein